MQAVNTLLSPLPWLGGLQHPSNQVRAVTDLSVEAEIKNKLLCSQGQLAAFVGDFKTDGRKDNERDAACFLSRNKEGKNTIASFPPSFWSQRMVTVKAVIVFICYLCRGLSKSIGYKMLTRFGFLPEDILSWLMVVEYFQDRFYLFIYLFPK